MTTAELEMLKEFFSSYFHEDWYMDDANPSDVIHRYKREGHPSDKLSQLAETIIKYVNSAESENNLEKLIFSDLGCYYLPSADGLTAQEWLNAVAKKLVES